MNRATLRSAALWYAQLGSGDGGQADRDAWQHWLQAHPDHQRAWAQVELLQHGLRQVPCGLAACALRRVDAGAVDRQRRAALKALTAAGVFGGAFYAAHLQTPWPQRLADYRTGVGRRGEWALADGSRLMLNTASAVDVHFDAQQRLLRLHAGEILIQTAPDAATPPRPFRVQTPQGRLRALGTRFTVRIVGDATEVSVLEHAVEVSPQAAAPVLLQAGQRLRFTRDQPGPVLPALPAADAWTRGMLVVANQTLGRFVAELARYRADSLSCDPAVAGLRLSGAYPVDDTDLALLAVEKSLPVKVSRRRGVWGLSPQVRVEPR